MKLNTKQTILVGFVAASDHAVKHGNTKILKKPGRMPLMREIE